jgi:hypothetical protein
MKPLVFIAAIFLWQIGLQANAATERAASGLEVSDASSVGVVIEDLNDKETKLGLSKEIIEARVNAVLRKNGLKPVDATPEATDHFYDLRIVVSGTSFVIEASFSRVITYNDGISERRTRANTWGVSYLGAWNRSPTGRSEGAVDSILKKVSEFTEVFANEFLKANQK